MTLTPQGSEEEYLKWSYQVLRAAFVREGSSQWRGLPPALVPLSAEEMLISVSEEWLIQAYIEKKTFQQGKALETTWLGSFIVEMLLLAWCHLVFISPKDWLPLTLQLIRTEWTGQLSTGEIYVRFLCRFCFSKKIQQWFLKYMVSLASHSGQAFHLSLNWNFLYQ